MYSSDIVILKIWSCRDNHISPHVVRLLRAVHEVPVPQPWLNKRSSGSYVCSVQGSGVHWLIPYSHRLLWLRERVDCWTKVTTPLNITNITFSVQSSHVVVYNLGLDQWRTINKLNKARFYPALNVSNTNFYAIRGSTNNIKVYNNDDQRKWV